MSCFGRNVLSSLSVLSGVTFTVSLLPLSPPFSSWLPCSVVDGYGCPSGSDEEAHFAEIIGKLSLSSLSDALFGSNRRPDCFLFIGSVAMVFYFLRRCISCGVGGA